MVSLLTFMLVSLENECGTETGVKLPSSSHQTIHVGGAAGGVLKSHLWIVEVLKCI